jgi:hypothetical protein
VDVESCAGLSRAGAGTSPFPSLRESLAATGANLRVFGFNHYSTGVKFQFHCSFANHVAAPADRTAREVLELVHFGGPIPFPPSPRVLG